MNFSTLPDDLLDLIITSYTTRVHSDLYVPLGTPPPGFPDEWENIIRRPPFQPPPARLITPAHWRALAPLTAVCRRLRAAVLRSVRGLSIGLSPPPVLRRLAAAPDAAGDAPPHPLPAVMVALRSRVDHLSALLPRLSRLTHLTACLHVDAPLPRGTLTLAADVWEAAAAEDRQGWLFFHWSVAVLALLPKLPLRSLCLHWLGDSFLAEHPSHVAPAAAPAAPPQAFGLLGLLGELVPPPAIGGGAAGTAAPAAPRLSGAPLQSLVLALRSAQRASGTMRAAWARPIGAAVARHADTLRALVIDAPDDLRYPVLGSVLEQLPRASRLTDFATSGALGSPNTVLLARAAPGLRALTLGRRTGLSAAALALLGRTAAGTTARGRRGSSDAPPALLPALEYIDMSSTVAQASPSPTYFTDLRRFFAARSLHTLLLSPGLYGPAVATRLTTAIVSMPRFPSVLSIPTPLSDGHVAELLSFLDPLTRLHLGDVEALSGERLGALVRAAPDLHHLDVGGLDGEELAAVAPTLGTVPELVLQVADWGSSSLADALAALATGEVTTTVTIRSTVVWSEDFEGDLDWWPPSLELLVLAGCRGLGEAEAAEVQRRLWRRTPPAMLQWSSTFPVW